MAPQRLHLNGFISILGLPRKQIRTRISKDTYCNTVRADDVIYSTSGRSGALALLFILRWNKSNEKELFSLPHLHT